MTPQIIILRHLLYYTESLSLRGDLAMKKPGAWDAGQWLLGVKANGNYAC